MESRNLYIRFYHPDISTISDRTLRRLLKGFSKICRGILRDEIERLILELELDSRQVQSVRDRTLNQLSNVSTFYVEKIEKGSLEVIVLLSAFSVWLLQATLGESVKRAFKGSDLGKNSDRILLQLFNKLFSYAKKRSDHLSENIVPSLQSKMKIIADRFIVERLEIQKLEDRVMIHVHLKTAKKLDIFLLAEKIDNETLMNEISKKIESLSKSIESESNEKNKSNQSSKDGNDAS